MKILILLLFIFSVISYKFRFLKGSFIKNSFYQPFFDELKSEHSIEFQEYLDFSNYDKETILISHSFGGFFALLHGIKNPEKIRAIILVNSHFNQNYQMPYFAIRLKYVSQPTLVIYTSKDNKLPAEKVKEDELEAIKEKEINKKFIGYEGTHTSLFENTDYRKSIIFNIMVFLNEHLPSS